MSLIENGRLIEAEWIASPNVSERAETEISLLVIHNISLPPGQFGTGCVQRFFTNQLPPGEHPYFKEIEGLEVSSHLLIERTGKVIQFVSFDKKAWHAGRSCFNGRDNCNEFSIGIELEGTDEIPYSSQQYEALARITRVLQQQYPEITQDRITGHEHIAPGRKTDPGQAFDWTRYLAMLSE